MFNRPLSPHLTIYSANIALLASVWHRITGISLLTIVVSYLLTYKLLYYSFWNSIFFTVMHYLSTNLFLWCINMSILSLILGYHVLSGLLHLKWDLSTPTAKFSIRSAITTVLIILAIGVFTVI